MNNFKIFLTVFFSCIFTEYVKAIDIGAGPIYDNKRAKKICPRVCADNNLVWKGNWSTVQTGYMSVCGCEPKDMDE